MTVADIRKPRFLLGHTAELLYDVLDRPDVPADLVISRFFGARRYLGSHDRGFISDLVYAILRDLLRLRRALGPMLERTEPEYEVELLMAGHLLDTIEGLPFETLQEGTRLRAHDLHGATELLKELNAQIETLPDIERLALRYGMPQWLCERIVAQNGVEEADAILESLNTQAPITLRVNTLVGDRGLLLNALQEQGVKSAPGIYSPDAILLQKRMNAHGIPEFKQGWFELQDEGSQLLSIALDPHPNWKVFDACAGAGGKTLHLAAIMRGRGEVVAHDINERRLLQIKPRIRRSRAQNIRILENASYRQRRTELLAGYNAVLIDAPCSGSGVLRRNPGARLTMDPEMVERITVQQREILDEYSTLVRPGGLLLYAVCSVLREEAEEQAEWFMSSREGWALETINAPAEMIDPNGYLRTWPHKHGTDGFFAALFKRKG